MQHLNFIDYQRLTENREKIFRIYPPIFEKIEFIFNEKSRGGTNFILPIIIKALLYISMYTPLF